MTKEMAAMGTHAGDRAVVLGGSMAGLLAARVLAEHYTEVTVVDRDRLAGVTDPRRGVPQGPHAHGLLARGHEILEELFPGLTDGLLAAGASTRDLGELRWYFNARRLQPARTGLAAIGTTRPLLEAHVRAWVAELPNVSFLEEHDIVGIAATADGGRVTGARVQPRERGSAERTIDADLVVDATGRGSRAPAWLAELGYATVAEDQIKIDLTYTTQYFKLRTNPFHGDQSINPVASPAYPRGAFFTELPDNQAQLSMTGVLGDRPPTDADGFLGYARSLPVPDVYEAVKDAEPLGDPVTFRFPASQRRRYERLDRFPTGFLVTGDAACSFNPVYGQGMTVAAQEAVALRDHLRTGGPPAPAVWHGQIARLIDAPWEISAGGDLSFPAVPGPRPFPVKLANAYMARLQRAATRDAEVTAAFMRVAGLIDPPQALMRPRLVLRVLFPRTNPHRQPTPHGQTADTTTG
jgi:2-polyprenyl-6-methoxyphenol hydroxylase-like FAD-dependent oxidoreductase